jgi:glycosyltransferase involved in cell wall biosynthesis
MFPDLKPFMKFSQPKVPMKRPTTRIVTNIPGLPGAAANRSDVTVELAANRSDTFLKQCRRADVVIIDDDFRKLTEAALLRWTARFTLVSVDLILRPPRSLAARARIAFKRLILSKISLFILYFRDTAGYTKHYGINPARMAYVPFKANGLPDLNDWPRPNPDGDVVLCAGRTLRDVGTFVAAIREAGCPGVLLQQSDRHLCEHGSRPWEADLPPNLTRVIDEADTIESFVAHLNRARILVIPRFKGDIAATGISTYLTAMALGKAVIISRGPGADDLLVDEAVMVEAEDASELAAAIRRLWSDDTLRRSIAENGRRYAERLAGEDRLCRDILAAALSHHVRARGLR